MTAVAVSTATYRPPHRPSARAEATNPNQNTTANSTSINNHATISGDHAIGASSGLEAGAARNSSTIMFGASMVLSLAGRARLPARAIGLQPRLVGDPHRAIVDVERVAAAIDAP